MTSDVKMEKHCKINMRSYSLNLYNKAKLMGLNVVQMTDCTTCSILDSIIPKKQGKKGENRSYTKSSAYFCVVVYSILDATKYNIKRSK
jgi:hypothetical protein